MYIETETSEIYTTTSTALPALNPSVHIHLMFTLILMCFHALQQSLALHVQTHYNASIYNIPPAVVLVWFRAPNSESRDVGSRALLSNSKCFAVVTSDIKKHHSELIIIHR